MSPRLFKFRNNNSSSKLRFALSELEAARGADYKRYLGEWQARIGVSDFYMTDIVGEAKNNNEHETAGFPVGRKHFWQEAVRAFWTDKYADYVIDWEWTKRTIVTEYDFNSVHPDYWKKQSGLVDRFDFDGDQCWGVIKISEEEARNRRDDLERNGRVKVSQLKEQFFKSVPAFADIERNGVRDTGSDDDDDTDDDDDDDTDDDGDGGQLATRPLTKSDDRTPTYDADGYLQLQMIKKY
jgi:hypothetical protein